MSNLTENRINRILDETAMTYALKTRNEIKIPCTTMVLIHCGFAPHQSKSMNQGLISKRKNPAEDSTTEF